MVGRILTASLHGLGVVLFYLGVAPLIRRIGRKNPKIILYHDCSPQESDYVAGLDCTTSPRRFEEHLNYLSQHYRFVDVEAITAGSAPDGAVAITFDDGYASVYDSAFPLLRARKVPATVYLISSVIDNRALVWVNELNHFLRAYGDRASECVRRHFDIPDRADPAAVISFCRLHYRPEKMQALLADLRALADLPEAEHAARARLYLTWDEIHEMRASGIEFGNHSRTHANMECLTEQEQAAEIADAQAELQKHLPQVRAFAHPFGHHGPATAGIASRSGLSSVANVGGSNSPVAPLGLGRTHMANESVAGLFARMEIVEPIKAFLRQGMRGATTAGA